MAAVAAGCEGRPRRAQDDATASAAPVSLDVPAVVELDLTRGIPELVPATLLGPARQRTHVDLVRSLRAIRDTDATKAVLVRLGAARIGFSRAHEVGRILAELRNAGRPVVCHADDYNNGTMLLAAVGCSRIWVSAAGGMDAVGLAAQMLYGNKLLTKLRIDVDFLQVGKYKGAQEPFTRDGPSPEARESLETALGGLHTAWLDAITKGRPKEGVAAAVDDGPYSAEEAKAKGLVDEVGYLDDARDEAKKLAGVDNVVVRFGTGEGTPPVSRGLIEVLRAVSGSSRGGTPHIAVVRAVGAISMAPSGMFGQSDGITERELSRVLTKLAKDASVKAVVLRIDSPGGSALASDLLWKRLMKLRSDKPLVVSIGGMAASGGYYLACAATKIVAEPTSIIGSIGVVGGKFALGKTLEEVGIHAETIAATKDPTKAARAAWLSPLSPWDEPTRQRMLASMTAIYDLFLKRIGEGRGVPVDKIAPSAEGRLFGGVLAKERGLIDELGGLEDAIRLAGELAKLPKDAPVDVIGETPGLLELLEGDGDSAEAARAELAAAAARDAAHALAPAWANAAPELGAFLGSAAPLLQGEKTLTALPFVLMIR
jgi:protease-4